jgi:hypothetical protein
LGEAAAGRAGARARGLAAPLFAARLYWTLPQRAPAQFHLICRLVGDPRDLLPAEAAALNVRTMIALLGTVAGLFEAAAGSGALWAGEAPRRVVFLWAGLQGLMQLGKLGRFEPGLFRAPDLCAQMTRDLLRGWGASHEDLDEAFGLLERFEAGKAEKQGEQS